MIMKLLSIVRKLDLLGRKMNINLLQQEQNGMILLKDVIIAW
ncbi:hypothetical protein J22TS1_43360 [Siminovitchia terrae]|nr:hypothetical protein [Siminovitchia terrae]GIN93285.1 hypothetical protein J22TS1_43360 [Siminovitchia terrae]